MSDANWREAARALRSGTVAPESFVEALGTDYAIIRALSDVLNRKEFELRQEFCSCGHEYFEHNGSFKTPDMKTCWATTYDSSLLNKTLVPIGRCGCKKFDAQGGPTQRPKYPYHPGALNGR
jgi:hypothetical protein